RLAAAGTAEAEVDHRRGVRVVGRAGDVQAGGPADRVGDVAVGAPAALDAEHAHREEAAVPVDAGDAEVVVGVSGDDPGDVHPVQAARGGIGAAHVGGIGIAPAAVARVLGIGDEVVA